MYRESNTSAVKLVPKLEEVCRVICGGIESYSKKIIVPKSISKDEMATVLEYIKNQKPELFYINPFEWSYTSGPFNLLNPKYLYSKQEAMSKLSELESLSQTIWDGFHGTTDVEKTEYIHDYLAEMVHYDYAALRNPSDFLTAYTMEGALLNRRATCSGIARAASYLLKKGGITSYIVRGEAFPQPEMAPSGNTALVPHDWNLNVLSTGSYYMDITWDLTDSSVVHQLEHSYCNVEEDAILMSHIWDSFSYPKANCLTDNYFVRRRAFFHSNSSLERYILDCLKKREERIECRLDPMAGFPDDEGRTIIKRIMNCIEERNLFVSKLQYTYRPYILSLTIFPEYEEE